MKATGNLGEAIFLAEAFERGLLISQPFGDCAPYDFIIDTFKKLVKIQVKTANRSEDFYYFNLTHGNKDKPYEKGSFHYLACYCVDLKMWYIIPEKYILGMSTLKISPFSMRATKYDKFYNNWSVIT